MAVGGVARVRARLRAFGNDGVRDALRPVIEQEAAAMAQIMQALAPYREIEVGWTWGAPPSGSVTVLRARARNDRRSDPLDLTVTIYATARTEDYPGGFPAVARWAEFGTAPRVQKTTGRFTGQITAQPYFFPVIRANRRRIRQRLQRALDRAAAQVRF